MNSRLTYKTAILALLYSFSSWGQSQISTIDLPSWNLKRLKNYVEMDLFYTHDYVSNTGGVKSGPRNIGALDIYFESDLRNFSHVPGEVMLHFTHIHGTDSRGNIGDAQYTSNIDMPTQVDRVGDLWYQHHWSEDLKTLFGLHDLSMEFNVTESTLQFLNSSFGTSAELGLSGASIYPVTALGFRAEYSFDEELSLKAALYDAQVGDESTYRGFHSDVGNHEGFFQISELAHQTKRHKIAVGEWNRTRSEMTIDEKSRDIVWGSYGIYEQRLGTSTWVFGRYGWANPKVSAIQSNLAAGVVYRGIFMTRKSKDEAGFGATRVHFSRLSDSDTDETAYETYYQFKPIKQLILRPDVQYVTNPSGLSSLKSAWAVAMRTVVEL